MTRTWIAAIARAGFLAKAVVYLVLGWLAFRAAMGTAGGRITNARGALQFVLREPFGTVLIALLAIGLAGYAVWRFIEAFADANRRGRSAKGLAHRAKYALSGATYGLLALDAARLATVLPAGGTGAAGYTSLVDRALLSWLGLIAGLLLVAGAALETRDAVAGRFSDRLDLGAVSREHGRWILIVARVGILARAAILAAAGALLLGIAGRAADPTGTDAADSLRLLAQLPQGRWVLALTAAGLMAYGVYQLLHARYRRIIPP